VPQGRAVGIDLWSQRDQGDNRKDATLANAHAEGVANRVEVYDGDMCKLPFENAYIDVVVASMSIHNIYNREGRREAINEAVRVLKPGGKVALMDFEHVKEYGEDLQAAGMQDMHVSGLNFWMCPPVRIATARKG
jgi:ubiquinone/menaquinone biosynthesis C-methylase UbiE